MVVAIAPGTATITASKGGSRTDIHVGSEHALLHCTTNARRAAADDPASLANRSRKARRSISP